MGVAVAVAVVLDLLGHTVGRDANGCQHQGTNDDTRDGHGPVELLSIAPYRGMETG